MKKFLILFVIASLFACNKNNNAEEIYNKAMQAYSEDNKFLANELCRQLPDSKPQYILLKAGIAFSQKDFKQASILLEKKKEKFHLSKFANYILIRSYLNIGDYENSEAELKELIKDDPSDFRAISLYGDLKVLQDDLASAVFLYANSIESCAEIASSCLKLGKIYYQHGQMAESEELFNKALVLIGSNDEELSNQIKSEISKFKMDIDR